MFQNIRKTSRLHAAIGILEVIYHATVKNVRKEHRNAFYALFQNIMQTIFFVAAFYVMFEFLGMRGTAIRGDYLLYMMSGIFLFMTHVKAMSAIAGAEGAASPIMQHAPMNTVVSIMANAIASLYTQVLALFVILFAYHVLVTPFTIHDPIGALGMMLIAWFTGCCVGLILLALMPWFPDFVKIFRMIYQRVNMVASGKMFVANTMPGYLLAMFDWNPLFHCIDQARGFMFNNYFPRNSSVEYPLYIGCALLVIGLLAEFYTRQYASSSWNARR